ncbi:AlpA family phage regulatory protein [Planktomarina temperata]|nr:AlpA family phage regulatory protein [Planktomarina temperata]
MKLYYRRKALEDMLGLSRSTIYRMMNHGEFPRPVRIGRRAVGWSSSDVEEWLKTLNEVSSD